MWFNEPSDGRIISWRNWRNTLENKPVETIVTEVASVWSQVPTVLHFLAPDTKDEWPNPWQLVTDNYYCDLGICLGMFYTLALIESPKFNNLAIEIYKTPDGWINLSSIDHGKYVLNFDHGRVVNSEYVSLDKINLVYSYSKIDLSEKFH